MRSAVILSVFGAVYAFLCCQHLHSEAREVGPDQASLVRGAACYVETTCAPMTQCQLKCTVTCAGSPLNCTKKKYIPPQYVSDEMAAKKQEDTGTKCVDEPNCFYKKLSTTKCSS